MSNQNAQAYVNKALADLRGFNVHVEIDERTCEVLLVKYNLPSVAKVIFQ